VRGRRIAGQLLAQRLLHRLRQQVDATGATAALLVAAAELLAPLLQLSAHLLRGAGVALLPFVGLVYGLSRQAAA